MAQRNTENNCFLNFSLRYSAYSAVKKGFFIMSNLCYTLRDIFQQLEITLLQ